MSYRKIISLFSILLLLLIVGCDAVKFGFHDKDIEAFMESQQLPDAQKPVFVLMVPDQNFTAFRVSFGPPRDCPSGCFYTQAFGIKYGSRIGWISVNTTWFQDSYLSFFDVRPDDDYLFSQNVRNRFKEVVKNSKDGSWNQRAYEVFLEMLARDTDTPSEIFLNISELLYREYHPGVASALIKNPVVKTNRLILETLANLPSFNESRFYKQVRKQAQELLNQLGE